MSENIFNWPIIGHENIAAYLQKSLLNNRMAHAYLFVGPDQLGKSTVAHNFVQSILCAKTDDEANIPCQRCVHCQQYLSNLHPDFNYIEKKDEDKNISIDQIRQLIQTLSLKTFISKYKVALIEQAEALEEEAANALLKTLEEPSGHTVIILITNKLESLPKTIVSRCQIVNFRPLPHRTIRDFLKDTPELSLREQADVSHLAQGRPGRIFNWRVNNQTLIDYQQNIYKHLSLFREPTHMNLLEMKNIIPRSLLFNQKISKLRTEINVWIDLVRDILLIKLGLPGLLNNYFAREEIEKLSDHLSSQYLLDLLNELIDNNRYLGNNPNPELTMENLLIKISNKNI